MWKCITLLPNTLIEDEGPAVAGDIYIGHKNKVCTAIQHKQQ